MADGQPQSRALTRRLGGEKRVEDLAQIFLGDTAARIAEDQVHGIFAAPTCGDGDDAAGRDGLRGIGKKIEDYLAQLGSVAVNHRQGLHRNGARW